MEIHPILMSVLAAVGTLLGLFGWSHRALRQRILEMEVELAKKPSLDDTRMLMADKMAPIHVEYNALTRRMDDLKYENHKLNDKIDKVLVLCSKMVHEKDSKN